MLKVVWKSYHKETPNRGYWDHAMLEAILSGLLWGFPFKVEHQDDYGDEPGAIVIIPGRYHAKDVDQINKDLARYEWVLLILTGDEEQDFPADEVKHPNIKIWSMTPLLARPRGVDRFLVNGWPPQCPKILKDLGYPLKSLDWSFMGQITHARRKACVRQMRKMKRGILVETDGFTKGLPPEDYYLIMAQSKVVPCPSGAIVPDSFRLYEALEAGCVPLVDTFAKAVNENGYWELYFDNIPFPIVENWEDLPGLVEYHTDVYPKTNNKVFAWWQGYKREMVYNMIDDLLELNGELQMDNAPASSKITVLIPTSSIASHPDTSIIDETIKSVRDRLPESEIIIMFDGLRDEMKDRTIKYQEYIKRMLWKCNNEYQNILPIVFDEHTHQARMTRQALERVRTDYIMFVEHDTPLCEEIPFSELLRALATKKARMIRLNHEALILPDHKHLALDESPSTEFEIPLIRTSQWSQRPHLAVKKYYQKWLDRYFSPTSRSMIEDRMHGIVYQEYKLKGLAGWNKFRIWIYAPEGDQKRSYHIDGRGQDPKYEMVY